MEQGLYDNNGRGSKKKAVDDNIVRDVMNGKYGNGHENRREAVEKMGYDYDEVRAAVNKKIDYENSKPSSRPSSSGSPSASGGSRQPSYSGGSSSTGERYNSRGQKTHNADGSVYYDQNGYDASGWSKPDAYGNQYHRETGKVINGFQNNYHQSSAKEMADYSNGHQYSPDYFNRDTIDRWNGIYRLTDPDEYGARYDSTGVSHFAFDPNYYGVDDNWVSDYAPYGRAPNGTPYKANGAIINSGTNKGRYNGEGYDPTGKSDPRRYEDTLKPIYAPGYGPGGRDKSPGRFAHPSFDPDGYDRASKDFNDAVDGGWDPNEGGARPSRRPSGGGSLGGGMIGGGMPGMGNNPYGDILAQLQAAKKQQMAEAERRLNEQKELTGKGFDDTAAMAYAQMMKRKELLGEQNSNIATGTADSLDLQSKIDYQNDLLSNEQKKQEALAGIDNAINDMKISGDLSLAQDAEKYALLAIQEQQRQQELAAQQKMWETERQDKLNREAREEAYRQQQLAQKASGGGSPKKDDDNERSLKELKDAYAFYIEAGDKESAAKVKAEYDKLMFGEEKNGRPQAIIIPELRQSFGSATAAIKALNDYKENGVITPEQYDKYTSRFL